MSYFKFGSLIQGITSTTTAAGTTTLTNTSTQIQNFTGSSTQTIVLPDATTMPVGSSFEIYDSSTGAITVNKNGGTLITVLTANTSVIVKLSDNGSAAGTWIVQAPAAGGLSIWQTGYSYSVNNVVLYEKNIYTCVTGNTSGATFEADIALGYWALVNSPQIGRNYMLVGNNFEDNDVGGWQVFTLQTQYTFTVTALTVATLVGSTYTNNGQTFTVLQNAAIGATSVVTSGTGAPTASGTLTKATGTGQTTIAYSANASSSFTAGSAPATMPTLGTASSMTLDINSTTQLSGKYSLRVNNTASTPFLLSQGIASQVFSIDQVDQAKILAHKFAYMAAGANAANMNFSGTSSNTWATYILDVTNTAWIQPAGVYNLVQSSGVGISTGTFQTPSNMTQFRIVLLCINSTTGTPAVNTVQLNVDDFYLGPQPTSSGAAMSDWVSYTPTFGAGFGTAASVSFQSRRVGDSLEILGKWTNGTVAASAATITIGYNGANGNVIIDTGKVPTSGIIGTMQGSLTSTTQFGVYPIAPASNLTTIAFTVQNSTTGFGSGAQNGNIIGASASQNSLHVLVPIVGWSSNTVQSADTDTRVVAFNVTGTPTGSLGSAWNKATLATVTSDTHGAFASGTYTIPVSGYYDFAASFPLTGSTFTANQIAGIQLQKNGTDFATNVQRIAGTTANFTFTSSVSKDAVYCNAGDAITVNSYCAYGTPAYAASLLAASEIYFSGSRRSGPATVQATESVNGRYTNATAFSVPNNATTTISTGWTKETDSHLAFSNGVITFPVSGSYNIQVSAMFDTQAWTTGNDLALQGVRTGLFTTTINFDELFLTATSTTYYKLRGSVTIKVNAGDTLSLKAYQNQGAARTLIADATQNYISWFRTGN